MSVAVKIMATAKSGGICLFTTIAQHRPQIFGMHPNAPPVPLHNKRERKIPV